MATKGSILAAAAALCLCCSCGMAPRPVESLAPSSQLAENAPSSSSPALPATEATNPAAPTPGNPYLRELVTAAVNSLDLQGKDDFGRVQAAYEYIIDRTYFAPPVGVDSWQLHGGEPAPDYLETRALSPLAYGIGSCEDYAAALVLLLRELGYPARYLPGITLSVQGAFVDHAWAAVQLRGAWYHLDPQLEDNVMKQDLLTYRYFLKSDKELLADHRWGSNLLQEAQLTPAQRQEVEQSWLLPPCTQSYQRPQPKTLPTRPRPNMGAIEKELAEERARYEAQHGPLPKISPSLTPPVFGNAGYGPPD